MLKILLLLPFLLLSICLPSYAKAKLSGDTKQAVELEKILCTKSLYGGKNHGQCGVDQISVKAGWAYFTYDDGPLRGSGVAKIVNKQWKFLKAGGGVLACTGLVDLGCSKALARDLVILMSPNIETDFLLMMGC